jgi:hypothetical protein
LRCSIVVRNSGVNEFRITLTLCVKQADRFLTYRQYWQAGTHNPEVTGKFLEWGIATYPRYKKAPNRMLYT